MVKKTTKQRQTVSGAGLHADSAQRLQRHGIAARIAALQEPEHALHVALRDETATRPTWRLGLKAPMAAVVRGRLEAPESVEDVVAQEPVLVDRLPGGATLAPGQRVRYGS